MLCGNQTCYSKSVETGAICEPLFTGTKLLLGENAVVNYAVYFSISVSIWVLFFLLKVGEMVIIKHGPVPAGPSSIHWIIPMTPFLGGYPSTFVYNLTPKLFFETMKWFEEIVLN